MSTEQQQQPQIEEDRKVTEQQLLPEQTVENMTQQNQEDVPSQKKEGQDNENLGEIELQNKNPHYNSTQKISGQVTNIQVQQEPSCVVLSHPNAFTTGTSMTEGNCKITEILPVERTAGKMILGIFLTLITFFIFYFVCDQNKKLYRYFFFSICTLESASYFLIKNSDGRFTIQKKVEVNGEIGFKNRHMSYFYNKQQNVFKAAHLNVLEKSNQEILDMKPLSEQDQNTRRQMFGQCLIDFKPTGFFSFFYHYFTRSNMILLYITLLIWILERFIIFVIVLLFFVFLILFFLFIFNYLATKKILKKSKHIVEVTRVSESGEQKIQSNLLTPGDVIKIQSDITLPCDVVLTSGDLFVNESNITGESDPVPKTQLEKNNNTYNFEANSHSTIYEGTKIINSNDITDKDNQAKAIVIRTGFGTRKGQVVRDCLFQYQKQTEFLNSLMKFSGVCIAVYIVVHLIMIYFQLSLDNMAKTTVWLKFGEGVINFCAASLVPFANVTLFTALIRLGWKKIEGVNPEAVYEAGNVQILCFDKTGTITQNTVNAEGYWSNSSKKMVESKQLKENSSNFGEDKFVQKLFATCHSAQQHPQDASQILGDIIDVQMFGLSHYNFKQKTQDSVFTVGPQNGGDGDLKVLKSFNFKSEFACMSVIVKEGDKTYLFIKGSPEKLKQLSNASTIPGDFDKVQHEYTINGYRVLGLAYKEINIEGVDLNNVDRTQFENNLNFLGFLIMENPLKEDSKEVFSRLLMTDMPLKIISGDNLFTVTHTAKQLRLMDGDRPIFFLNYENNQITLESTEKTEGKDRSVMTFNENDFHNFETKIEKLIGNPNIQMAMTGKFFQYMEEQIKNNISIDQEHASETFFRIILVTSVFSRATPEQKRKIIKILKNHKLKVAMIGDGANDCSAIEEATVGISFASAEAALASSFCTTTESISCVESIIAEGINTMETNYEGSHLFMQMSFARCLINLIMIFYYQQTADFQLTFSSYYFGYIVQLLFITGDIPLKTISKERVHFMMTSRRSLMGIAGRWLFSFLSLIVIHFVLQSKSKYDNVDYEILEDKDELNREGLVNTYMFYYYAIQTAFLPIILYLSKPTKTIIFRNYLLTLAVFAHLLLCIYILFAEGAFKNLKLQDLPSGDRTLILIMLLVGFLLALLWEKLLVNKKFMIVTEKVINDLRHHKSSTVYNTIHTEKALQDTIQEKQQQQAS